MILRSTIGFCVREPWLVVLLFFLISVAGWFSYRNVPIDAIPDVGENQVIVLTPWPGRSPKDIEDQVTYPLSASLLAVPGAESVRGKSMFGYSFVQVTFRDDVDFYWARSRVSEQLSSATSELPEGVTPQLGPDATGLGQIYYYVLRPPPEGMALDRLRSLQDYVVKYELQSVPGVSEVASIGGYVRQYQVEVDPDRLRFHRITLQTLTEAIQGSNLDVGAKTVETTGMEFIVRSKGFLGSQSAGEPPNRSTSGVDEPGLEESVPNESAWDEWAASNEKRTAIKVISDLEDTVIVQREGIPVRVSDVARLQIGPDFRRGALDFNGCEAVGGVVVMRHGENPREVIQAVQEKIAGIQPGLGGVTIQGVYDRTLLIDETIQTLTDALLEEICITALVILLFLMHIRSSLIVASCLPTAVLMSFIAMRIIGVDSNIMSLSGIAIAIGTMVDMAIIVTENVYGRLAEHSTGTESDVSSTDRQSDVESHAELIRRSVTEVAPAVSTAVATTIVSFLPVFFLTGRDAKLFSPLAYTKSFAIAAAMITAITLVPALCRLVLQHQSASRRRMRWSAISLGILMAVTSLFVWGPRIADWLGLSVWIISGFSAVVGAGIGWLVAREQIRSIDELPTSRLVNWAYSARLRFALNHKWLALSLPALLMLFGAGAWLGLPTVLRPIERFAGLLNADLNQVPGYVDFKHSFTGLQSDDWIALDEGSWFYMPTLYPAAGFSQAMQVLQTQDVLISQIPEVKDVLGKIGRVDSALDPAPAAMIETYVMLKPKSEWRDNMDAEKIWDQINRVATLPGVTPASALQPIEGRVVMLQSGIKAPMAIRIYGDQLSELAKAATDVATVLKRSPLINAATIAPDIVLGKPYIEFSVRREAASRYGMNSAQVNRVIETALGGSNLITTIEGRQRYPVRLRYRRDLREQIDQLPRLPVITPSGATVPLGQLATVESNWGPGAIQSENGRLVAHVAFMTNGRLGDLESIAAIEEQLGQARRLSPENDQFLSLPEGYSLEAVGSFRNQIEANQRLMWIIPLVICINLTLIYLQFRNLPISLAVFSGIPFAFAGGMILVALLGVELNTAVWVGFIALFGLAVDDGVVMATYIHQLMKQRRPTDLAGIRKTVFEAGVKRIRPCMMTTVTTLAALVPVMLSDGRGADAARAMAIPVFGGMLVEPFTSFIVPTLYCGYLELRLRLSSPSESLELTDAE